MIDKDWTLETEADRANVSGADMGVVPNTFLYVLDSPEVREATKKYYVNLLDMWFRYGNLFFGDYKKANHALWLIPFVEEDGHTLGFNVFEGGEDVVTEVMKLDEKKKWLAPFPIKNMLAPFSEMVMFLERTPEFGMKFSTAKAWENSELPEKVRREFYDEYVVNYKGDMFSVPGHDDRFCQLMLKLAST